MTSSSIGERLKSARETKRRSLEEVAKATKIQRSLLEAIEEDRVEEVLDSVYAKIFLKKYATFLGLDGSSLMEEFLSSHGPVPEGPITLQTEVTKRKEPSFFQRILVPAGVTLVALVGLAFMGYLSLDLYRTLSGKSDKSSTAVAGTPRQSKGLVPRSQPLKLTVRAKANVWMQVKSDGSVIFQNVLPKGSQESWTARQELELWTGNAGAMELALNGRPLRSAGTGVKKGIKVTHEGLTLP